MTCRQLVLKHLSGTMKLLSHSKYPLLAQSSRSFGDLSKQHGEQFIPRVWQEYTRRAFIMITVACCYPALC
jgi:hypothetical protein